MTLDERLERLRDAGIALWGLGSSRKIEVSLYLSDGKYYADVSGRPDPAITGRSSDEALTLLEQDIQTRAQRKYEHLFEAVAEFDP